MHAPCRLILSTRRHRSRAVAVGAALLLAGSAQAGNMFWICGGFYNFDRASCWASGAVPSNGDTVYVLGNIGWPDIRIDFPGGGLRTLTLNDLLVDGGLPSAPVKFVVNGNTLNVTRNTIIGNFDNAALSLEPGFASATLNTGNLVLGQNSGSTGTLRVSGANSTLHVADRLQIGSLGSGQLTQTGGNIQATRVDVNETSWVSLSGGRLITSQMNNLGQVGVYSGVVFQAAELNNAGRMYLGGGSSFSDMLTNSQTGDFRVLGWAEATMTRVDNRGTMVIVAATSDHTASLTASSVSNQGWFQVGPGGVLRAGSLVNEAEGVFIGYGSAGTNTGTGPQIFEFIENKGTFKVEGTVTVSNASAPLVNSGWLLLSDDHTLKVNQTIQNTGVIQGPGTLDAGVENRGRIAVNDTTQLRITGKLFNATGGTVELSSSLETATATLAAGSLSNQGALTVGPGGVLRAGSLVNEVGGVFTAYDGRSTSPQIFEFIENKGRFSVQGQVVVNNASAPFTNSGTLVVEWGGLAVNQSILNTGLIQGRGTFDAALDNHGRLLVPDNTHLNVTGNLFNATDGVIELAGAVASGTSPRASLELTNTSATLVNQGRIVGAGYVFGTVLNQGSVVAVANGDLVLNGSYSADEGAVQRAEAGGHLFFYGPASFAGNATVDASVAMFIRQLQPGGADAAGRLTVTGTTWLSGATLSMEILGLADHDQLATHELLLSNQNMLRLSSGSFMLQAGQRFDLFDWTTRSGSFTTIDTSGLLLAANTTLDLSRLYVDGTIGVTAVPEPAAWMLLAPGLLLVWRRQRAQRRSAG